MKAQFIIIATLLALVSCKKDKIETQAQFTTPKTAGSYWVYEWVQIDKNGVETPLSVRDSIYVYGDTTINYFDYTIYKGSTWPEGNYTSIQRDSSGYVVTLKGNILYSYHYFNDTLGKGSISQSWDYYLKMYDNIQVTVPAGTYNSIEARRYYYYESGDPANYCGDAYFTLGKWYVDGIGKVKETNGYFGDFLNCRYREARLIDYYIAP